MRLEELLSGLKPIRIEGSLETDISDVAIDSRQVREGSLFVAVKGTNVDGHDYIPKALDGGAKCIVAEQMPKELRSGVTYVQLASTQEAVGLLATKFNGDPTSKLKLVGVTGTNGKTTIATLLYTLFRRLGHKCGLISTVCNYIEEKPYPTEHTTPDPISLNRLLGLMAEEECEYVFMECSSHAIDQKRISGLKFAGGIFTNLTRDHLDYHKTLENYRDAKKAFFDGLPKGAFAITNADDRNGMIMVQNTKATVKTYSTRSMADWRGRIIESHFEGMYLDIDGHEVGVRFIGKFNLSNLLAVYGAARMLGKPAEDILLVMSTLHSVRGRLEPIKASDGRTAVVDYAHTPDALENVLKALKEVKGSQGRIITVCGAGGNRDRGKRPLMAQEAVKGSDFVIITSDNPRFEEPQAIIDDMLEGLNNSQRKRVLSIVDRREAIRAACLMATKDDVVLIAGKGHEDYQDVKGVKHHFDDREEAIKTFRSLE